ncbi:MAG: ribosomal-protein-alanine N-acetyltransferase [Gallionellales bacterium 35-53-114]|jgi:ribosomal-protein-alanine N-acetyltransferase|nr:MAG: ribosomal-protein-alanine N-acetyltransferase [Gallionellales bacterium 35-53-114]OYZ62766.1 MAG: ribosomal-protein-alanine N-acetyltransferase [Gallionellales bacterium 24-53-125]OZB09842.1 MAG: ribosomal-protein-alanine N-acetyltransferase [Gallionellales bacterium 39-52-133]HQS57593.1 ribosomal protein S18-alanine N-acetyltransferase [Gallionellaceae bacterium]HQS74047.1 ribosomal protein S18-alanine N-acetyltransferase [Gallionellaceae bacterium]
MNLAMLNKPVARLRDMIPADLDAVLSIEQQVHSHPWTRGMFNDALAQGNICKILATENEIVGYAVLMPALDEVHLLDISIAPACQRMGWGEKLLNELIAVAVQHQFLRMILEVRRSNIAAAALYRKTGFAEIGVRRDYYPAHNAQREKNNETAPNNREDALVMEYKLQ